MVYRKLKLGITLIETLMYLAIFALVVSTIMPVGIFLGSSEAQANKLNDLFREITFIQDKILFLLAEANLVSSPVDTPLPILEFETFTGENVKVYLENKTIYIQRNGQSLPLHDPKIKIDNLYFSRTFDSEFSSLINLEISSAKFIFSTTSYVVPQ